MLESARGENLFLVETDSISKLTDRQGINNELWLLAQMKSSTRTAHLNPVLDRDADEVGIKYQCWMGTH